MTPARLSTWLLPAAKAAMPVGCVAEASAASRARSLTSPTFANTEPGQKLDAPTVDPGTPPWRVRRLIGCVMFRGGLVIRRGVGVWRLAPAAPGFANDTHNDDATPAKGCSGG